MENSLWFEWVNLELLGFSEYFGIASLYKFSALFKTKLSRELLK